MCGESGTSFANLLVEQYQSVSEARGAFKNTELPQLPQNFTWLEDN